MPLESPQAVRDRLDDVASRLLDGTISSTVAEVARKVLATAADTFRTEATTALAPVAPPPPAISGASTPNGPTFNITFATTPNGPVFSEVASTAEPKPVPRVFEHPEPAPRPDPPRVLAIEPETPPQPPPPKPKSDRQQATAKLLALHRSRK
jgi:hypothetical protein